MERYYGSVMTTKTKTLLVAGLLAGAAAPLVYKSTTTTAPSVTSMDALIPMAVVLPPRTNWWFVVTALRDGLESGFSNEVSTTNSLPTLAWDRSDTNCTYRVYRGTNSGQYNRSWDAGTNLLFTIPKDILLTNIVITVTTTGTNLAYATTLKGPWTKYNKTTFKDTNPPTRYWRGLGQGSKVVTTAVFQ